MKRFFGALIFFLLAAVIIALMLYPTRGRIIGTILEPQLEILLSRLFDMKVRMDDLFADPISGDVKTRRIVFHNQPQFADQPHLDAALEAKVDFNALFDKKVLIAYIHLTDSFYFIDRIKTSQGPRNNVSTWVKYMKRNKGPKKPDDPGKKKWLVDIGVIRMKNGIFVFHDRSKKDSERKLYFQNLEGYLAQFKWPTDDPSRLYQTVEMKGDFGETYPAPFDIKGKANFATGKVSFDLNGYIPEGNVLEHDQYWRGSPIEVTGGTFELSMHAVCDHREFQSENHLELKKLQVVAGSSVVDKISGMPVVAWMKFLQSEEILLLDIPVRGNITSPEFEFHYAFRNAFYKALQERTSSGIRAISNGTAKLAQQTTDLAQKAPQTIATGLEKITTIVGINKES